MVKRVLVILLALFLSSCSQIRPAFLVARGNYRAGQGDYQEADVDYLNSLDAEIHRSLIYYNQGNLYYFLGEPESAINSWNLSEEQEGYKLPYRLNFNRGVLYYDLGNYQEAYNSFRKALELNPGSIDTKINLELTLAKLGGTSKKTDSTWDEESTLLDDTERLLYYIRNKEHYQWSQGDSSSVRSEKDW